MGDDKLEGYGGHYGYPSREECEEVRLKDQLTDIIRKEETEGRATRPIIGYAGEDMGVNEKQYGGDHWKSRFQHWDLVAQLGLDYFQGNATKYVSRWRKKNGAEDLQKAAHYCEKAIDLGREESATRRCLREDWMAILFQFCADNRLTNDEYCVVRDIILESWTCALGAIMCIAESAPKVPATR
jgi:hypothetical protein